ncbi:YbaB/EbfC family nucleoid-associated protein [Mycetocola reblochoni]|uniref:YbaB/EbfC DNA-binding family protein n=2 Tax=Mycetocola reblochoni TaxID=331618 RepID=A0A1R4IA70_9MICO|nr:YbaB/EbfC family nucleoid-associated protein [Mycetocola reblochoni]RLP68936.1 YbaB/EbfC family DNA-binding protein [Mycetocola reblochoni]SJN16193.1 hypothetical protein FM119_00410 [Mycetocola reblochoni REB411]
MRFDETDIEQMMAELRGSHGELERAAAEMEAVTATSTSKDRVFSATVDGHGRLGELRITGQAWRELSAKELGARIVAVVTQAQADAAERTASLLAGLAPAGTDPATGLPSELDMESMLRGLVEQFEGHDDER